MEIKYIGYIQLIKELLNLGFFKRDEKTKAIIICSKFSEDAPAIWRSLTIGEYAQELINDESKANELFAVLYSKRMKPQFDENGYFVSLLKADENDLPFAYSEDTIHGCMENVPSLTVKLRHINDRNQYNLIEAANFYYTALGVFLPNQAFSQPFFDELFKAVDYTVKEAQAVAAFSPFCRLIMGVHAFKTKDGIIKLPEAAVQFGKDEPLIMIYSGFASEDGKTCIMSVKKHSKDFYKTLTVRRAAAIVSQKNKEKAPEQTEDE